MKLELELKTLITAKSPLTLAVAESITCGHFQSRIGAVSGASNYFLGGITAYSLEQKVKHLSVNRLAARRVNCVSQRVAVEMAQGAAALFGSDLGAATTGYAEVNRNAGVKVPMAWWALCHVQRRDRVAVVSGMIEMPGASRAEAQARVTSEVLGALVAYLREYRADVRRKNGQ
jgi:nicotinamide-nucleotide amidase